MSDDIRILVVDDHVLVRDALAERLQREDGLTVSGHVGTADEALEHVGQHKPDIVLMDIDMPGLDCFYAAGMIGDINSATRVIFLSGFIHDRYIEEALRSNARGYLTKREPPEKVVAAIREVASGGAYFSEEVQERIEIDSHGVRLGEEPRSRKSTLTRRELESLRYLARGMAKKEIAKVMHLSIKTVDRHVTALMNKLDIHDRVDLTRFAIREGLATP